MSDNGSKFWLPAFDQLGEQLARAGRAEGRSRQRRSRWVIPLIGLSLVAAPAAVALTSLEDGPSVELTEDGLVIVNGEAVDCPVDAELTEELGFDPCEAFTTPAPAPEAEQPQEGSSSFSSPAPAPANR